MRTVSRSCGEHYAEHAAVLANARPPFLRAGAAAQTGRRWKWRSFPQRYRARVLPAVPSGLIPTCLLPQKCCFAVPYLPQNASQRTNMQHISVWVKELIKLLGGWRLHPVTAQCPICQQRVRLHVNKAGRRHVFAHARTLYEGSRLHVHYTAKVRCVGSGAPTVFDPRPNEHQRFKLPDRLVD